MSIEDLPVYDFESLDCDYDFIICAFHDSDSAYYIASEQKIDLRKVIFLQPGFERRLFNDSSEIADILQDEYENYLRRYKNDQKLYKRENVEWINYWDNVHYYQGAYEYISDLICEKIFGEVSLTKLMFVDTLEDLIKCII